MHRGDLIAGRYERVEWLGRGGTGEVWTHDHRWHPGIDSRYLQFDRTYPAIKSDTR